MTTNKRQKEKIMTLKEAIQKDDQRHLYVQSEITSGTTQYYLNLYEKIYQYEIINVK